MTDSVRDLLAEAAHAGRPISIVYHGGSQPGAARVITPLSLTDTEVIARDDAAGIRKTFLLHKIEIPASTELLPQYDPLRQAQPDETLGQFFAARVSELQALGWHVELSEDCLSLGRYFRNGKPRKSSDVSLSYNKWTVTVFDDFDGRGLQEEKQESKRPYCLRSTRAQSRTFTRILAAADAFWQEAKALAPQQTAPSDAGR
jgi:hypothetical protein